MEENFSHYFEKNISDIETDKESDAKTIAYECSNSRLEDLDSDDDNEVYICLLLKQTKIGGAFYDVQTATLHLIADYEDVIDYFYIKQTILQLNPTSILLSCNCDPTFVEYFKKSNTIEYEQDENEFPVENSSGVELLPMKQFSLELGHRRLLEFDLPYIPKTYSTTDKHTFMRSLIPFDSGLMVRSACALIGYLQSKRVGIELETIASDIPVMDIRLHVPDSIMLLGSSTLESLQIFKKISHPSTFKKGQIRSSKEGLSVYSIMNTCRSKSGSAMLRNWLMRPLCSFEEINARLNTVSMLLAPMAQQTVKQLMNATKSLSNIRKLFLRLKQSSATSGMWSSFCKTLNCFIMIADALRPFSDTELHIAERAHDLFDQEFLKKMQYFLEVVDVETTLREREFTVHSGIFPELDGLRSKYAALPDLLTEVAKVELRRLNFIIEECAISYSPQVGYLISAPATYEFPEDLDEHGLYYLYTSEKKCFFRNETTNELNRKVGDVFMNIKDFQTDVMHYIQESILSIMPELLKATDLATEIDCLLAYTTAAKEMNAVAPEFISENKICIKKGRHPLVEICQFEVVPNSTLSGEECPHVTIISGPNSSGKSVYIKQVGLLVYLAHVGCFVPAESMQLGLIKSLHTRVKSKDSGITHQSSFITDCNEVGMAIRDYKTHSGSRQLLLLDEFGSGAAHDDGISILGSTLLFYLDQGQSCPHIFVSTHYHHSLLKTILLESRLLSYKTLKVIEHEEGKVTYLFELITGYSKRSYAFYVALMAGLSESTVERGQEVMMMLSNLDNLAPEDMPEWQEETYRAKIFSQNFLNFDFERLNIPIDFEESIVSTDL